MIYSFEFLSTPPNCLHVRQIAYQKKKSLSTCYLHNVENELFSTSLEVLLTKKVSPTAGFEPTRAERI
jgi:hypothetical protein